MRAAIYARFSSDLQDLRSIADQVELARRYAEGRSLNVVGVYDDAAISGVSTLNRPGLLRLIADAQARRFDAIVTESLDRLSRSQADIAALFEKLQFLGVRIETLADGPVSEIHVGLKGTMSALFLKDLAQKTRRGQIGRVKAGRIPGGKSYGYDVLKDGDDRGRRHQSRRGRHHPPNLPRVRHRQGTARDRPRPQPRDRARTYRPAVERLGATRLAQAAQRHPQQ